MLHFGFSHDKIASMYVKILIFTAVLTFFAGNACAGVICAEWGGRCSGITSLSDGGQVPSGHPTKVNGWLVGDNGGMEGVPAAGAGVSSLSAALFCISACIPALCLVSRLACEDHVLPASPTLEGLIKPA